jgi:hypothetical protein
MTEIDEPNEQEEVNQADDELKSSKAFLKAITTTLTEVIDAAVRDRSADPEYPDTPPETWQMLFVLLNCDRVLNLFSADRVQPTLGLNLH